MLLGSSDSVGLQSPNKDSVHSLPRSLTPSCEIHEDDHRDPPGRLTPDRPMSRSKTLPNVSSVMSTLCTNYCIYSTYCVTGHRTGPLHTVYVDVGALILLHNMTYVRTVF